MLTLCVGTMAYANKITNNHKYIYSGYIFDKDSKQPLINAFVELIGENNSGVTDDKGFFELHFNNSGKYVLEISYYGYKTEYISFSTDGMPTKPESIFLEPTSVEMEEVVVTGGRTPVKKRESPVVVSTLSSKTFESLSVSDLSQGLNFNSGLRVETTCQNCGFPQLKINGLEGTYTQMLIDGRPIMGALSAVYGLEQMPINMIDKVEVVKGGGSTLYGSNAIAGVVNIITKESTENFGNASANYNNIDAQSSDYSINANGGLVSKNQMHGITMFGSHRHRDAYDRDGDGYSEIGKMNSTSFGLKGYSKFTKMSKLSYEYHVIDDFRRGGNKLDLPAHQSDITEQTDYTINNFNINYDIFFDYYKHKLSVYSSAQHTKRDSYYGSEQSNDAYGNTKEIISMSGVQMSHNFQKLFFAPANLIYGAEYRYVKLNDNMPGYDRKLQQKVNQWSGFLQNQWNTKKFNFLVGARIESHNLINKPIVAPRANILYKTTKDFSIRASYANGFKAPEAFDEDLHVAVVNGEPTFIKLDKDLKPERSNSGSLSIDWNIGKKDLRVNIAVDGFYTDLKNVFVNTPIESTSGANEYLKTNGKGAWVGGVNFDGTLMYKDMIQLKAGYTYQKSRYKEAFAWSEDATVAPVKDRLRSPEHYGYFSFLINPTKRLSVNVNSVITGSMLVPHVSGFIEKDRLEKTSAFFDMGLKVAYLFQISGKTTLELSAGVKNVFDSYQTDFDKGTFRDSAYVYGPSLPRTYFVGLKLAL